MKRLRSIIFIAAFFLTISAISDAADPGKAQPNGQLPPAIQAIFNKPLYKGAVWGLRVVDSDGKVVIDYNPKPQFFLRLRAQGLLRRRIAQRDRTRPHL